ncbi:AAA family ATPase [Vibrio sinaloensis]|uniref:AAA family ATPase n=1 Tax=Photobacterium sp. (strain ATCC 43367) TaxID=379097 RepID=UPI00057EC721|nr:AAA family ATPase [Vibrio sinaloensis]KHT50065.1 hypothetical protein RJ46_07450 [Vibrio sinaloensis]
MARRILPNQVFTPRKSEVNADMYVDRSQLEEELIDALYGTNHILIHGESGTGKSWLYKHTFSDQNVPFMIANLSNASRLGGLEHELSNLIHQNSNVRKTGYEEEKSAGLNAGIGSGKLLHKATYEIFQKEPFEECLELLFNQSQGGTSCLVFDNFEQILDQSEIIREVANCIILLDDDRYSKYNVKIVIVGVPNGIERYFASQPNVSTIINRITEITEVGSLSDSQALKLPVKGFRDLLGYSCDDYDKLATRISFATNKIPQQLQELCYAIAMQLERHGDKNISSRHVINGSHQWFKQSLSGSFATINSILEFDESTTELTRVLYAIGHSSHNDINPSYVTGLVQTHFPIFTGKLLDNNKGQNLIDLIDVESILQDISKAENPILRLSPNKKTYRFVRPQYRMCLRVMLELDQSEYVRMVDRKLLLQQLTEPEI